MSDRQVIRAAENLTRFPVIAKGVCACVCVCVYLRLQLSQVANHISAL